MKQIYLVTGASGFVGSCITRRLVEQGKTVHVLTRKTGNWRLKDIESKLHIHTGDLLDPHLKSIVRDIKPRYVFHLAAFGSLPTEEGLEKMLMTNVLGTENLLHALDFSTVKLFINTGSSSEYMTKTSAFTESDALGPMNDYAVSKAAQTLLCEKEAKIKTLPIITFRLFSPYGAYEEKNRFVPYVISQALKNSDILLSNPNHVRDFIFIDDVIDAYLLASQKDSIDYQTYNIGSGKQHTTSEVVTVVLNLTKSTAKPLWGQKGKQQRQLEPKIWQANITRALLSFDWKPKHTLLEGLSQTITWHKDHNYLYA